MNANGDAHYNRRHGRRGYLFWDRFKSVICSPAHQNEVIRYVNLNPLRAGMVRDLDELAHYRWSGHRAFLGETSGCAWQCSREVLNRFPGNEHQARLGYIVYMKEYLNPETFPALEGLRPKGLRKREVDPMPHARSYLAHLAYRELGIPFIRVGEFLGIGPSAASLAAGRGWRLYGRNRLDIPAVPV